MEDGGGKCSGQWEQGAEIESIVKRCLNAHCLKKILCTDSGNRLDDKYKEITEKLFCLSLRSSGAVDVYQVLYTNLTVIPAVFAACCLILVIYMIIFIPRSAPPPPPPPGDPGYQEEFSRPTASSVECKG